MIISATVPYLKTLNLSPHGCLYEAMVWVYANDNNQETDLTWLGEEMGDFMDRCERITKEEDYEYYLWNKDEL